MNEDLSSPEWGGQVSFLLNTFEMKNLVFGIFTIALMSACQSIPEKKIEAAQWLSSEEQASFMNEIRSLQSHTKIESDAHSSSELMKMTHSVKSLGELVYYYEEPELKECYFVLLQPAPSIHEKYVALGAKITRSEKGEILSYEEVFRTWKHPKEVILERGAFLFKEMIAGHDLSAYNASRMGDTYIEFPNEHVSYDRAKRQWISHQHPLDSLQQLR